MKSVRDLFRPAAKEPPAKASPPPPVHGTMQFLQSENLRLKEELEDVQEEVIRLRLQLRALKTLQEVTMQISPHTNLIALLERVLQSALMSIGATDGSLMLVDEETHELVFAVVHGQVKHSLVGHRIPLGMGIAGWVAREQEAVVIPDVQQDERFASNVDQSFQFHTRSMICVPIVHEERVLGVFQAINKFEKREFTDSDLTIMLVVAQLSSNVLVKAEKIAAEQDA